MVGVLIRLKLTLLRNQARAGTEKVVLLVVGTVMALGVGAGLTAGLLGLRFVALDLAGAVVVIAGGLGVLAWSLLPLLTSSDDVLVDPARFALLPLRPRTLAAGLLVATALSPMGVVTVVSSLTLAVTFSRGPAPVASVAVALVAALAGSATCLLASRTVLTSAAAALAGRRGREITIAVGVLTVSLLGLAGPALAEVGERLRSGSVDALVQVVAWSPLGAAWAAPWAAAEGRWTVVGGRGLVAGATLVGLWLLYTRAVRARLRPTGAARSPRTSASRPLRRPGRSLLPDTPLGALTGRCLRYWLRDSRYQVSVIALPVVVGLLLVLPRLTDSPAAFALVTGPLLGLLLALSMLNELAFDGSALWTSLSAGVRGRDDRSARVVALLVWAAPFTVVVSVLGTMVGGRPELAPAAVGLAVGTLLVGNGVAAVSSVALAFPVPPAGSNPFSGNAGAGAAALLQQGASMLVLGPLLLPLGGLAAWAWFVPAAGWLLVPVGTAWGVGLLAVGISVGGRVMDRRGPELLGRLTR